MKPRLLDLQVAFEEREFLPQGHLLAFGLFQADAQKFAQARYDSIGVIGIFMNQSGDGVQRVEQKVRVELHAQHLQTRAHQLGGQRRGLQFALATSLIITPTLMGQHDRPIDHQSYVEIKNDQLLEHIAELEGAAVHDRFLTAQKPGINREVNQGDEHGRPDVAQDPAFHAFPFEVAAASHPQDANG